MRWGAHPGPSPALSPSLPPSSLPLSFSPPPPPHPPRFGREARGTGCGRSPIGNCGSGEVCSGWRPAAAAAAAAWRGAGLAAPVVPRRAHSRTKREVSPFLLVSVMICGPSLREPASVSMLSSECSHAWKATGASPHLGCQPGRDSRGGGEPKAPTRSKGRRRRRGAPAGQGAALQPAAARAPSPASDRGCRPCRRRRRSGAACCRACGSRRRRRNGRQDGRASSRESAPYADTAGACWAEAKWRGCAGEEPWK